MSSVYFRNRPVDQIPLWELLMIQAGADRQFRPLPLRPEVRVAIDEAVERKRRAEREGPCVMRRVA